MTMILTFIQALSNGYKYEYEYQKYRLMGNKAFTHESILTTRTRTACRHLHMHMHACSTV